jgi:hypothetical protein
MAYATYYGRALRWAIFLRPLRPDATLWNLLKATIIGFTAVVLLGRPGEFVRPYLISVKEAVPMSSQLAMWFLERIFDLLFALLIFGYGLSRVQSSQAHVGSALQWTFQVGGGVVWGVSVICLILLVLLRQHPRLFQSRLMDSLSFLPARHSERVEKIPASFLEGVESTSRRTLAAFGDCVLVPRVDPHRGLLFLYYEIVPELLSLRLDRSIHLYGFRVLRDHRTVTRNRRWVAGCFRVSLA